MEKADKNIELIEAILVMLDMLTNRMGSGSIDMVKQFFSLVSDLGLVVGSGSLDLENCKHMMNLLGDRRTLLMLGELQYDIKTNQGEVRREVIKAKLNQLVRVNNVGLGEHVMGWMLDDILDEWKY